MNNKDINSFKILKEEIKYHVLNDIIKLIQLLYRKEIGIFYEQLTEIESLSNDSIFLLIK